MFCSDSSGRRRIKNLPGFCDRPERREGHEGGFAAENACYAVGGVDAENFDVWVQAGVDGAGIGGGLYKPGEGAKIVHTRAVALVDAYDQAFADH